MEQWRRSWSPQWRRLKYRGNRLYQRGSQLAIQVAKHPLGWVQRAPAGGLRKLALFALFVLICFVPYLLRPLSVKLAALVQIFWSLGALGVGLSIALLHFLVEKERDALAHGLLSTERKRYSEAPVARYLAFEKQVDFGTLLVACGGMILAFGFLSQGIYDLGLKSWYATGDTPPGLLAWWLFALGHVARALDIFNVLASVGAGTLLPKGAATSGLVFAFKAVFDLLLLATIRDWWSKRSLVLEAIPALSHDETRKRAEETLRRCRKYALPHLVDVFHSTTKTPVKRSALGLLYELRYPELMPLLLASQESKEEALRVEAARLLGKVAAQVEGDDDALAAAIAGFERGLRDVSAEVRAVAASSLGIPGARDRVVPLLLKALKDPAGGVREQAAGALKELAAPESREALLEALQDKEAKVRTEAVAAVAQFEEEIFSSLAPMLDDPNKAVRAAVIDAIGEQLERDPEEALSLLLGALEDVDPEIRVSVVEHIRWSQSARAIPQVGALLQSDKSSEVRQAAAEMLGYTENARAIEPLHKALNDGHYQVRCKVIEALGDLRARDAVGEIVALLTDGDRDVRRQAAITLGEMKAKQPQVLSALEAALDDTDRHVRAAAVEALSELTDGTSPALVRALQDEHPSVRTEAIYALGFPVGEAFVPLLLERLQDKAEDRDVRKAAIDVISYHDKTNWASVEGHFGPLLPGLLDEDDLLLRGATLEAIGSVAFDGADALLVPALRDELSDIRVAAVEALSFVDGPQSLPALIDALGDENLRVRTAAAQAIGEFAERGPVPSAVAPLMQALQSDEQEVRKSAALALAQVEAQEALQALLDAAVDGDAQVRQAAAEALGVRHAEKDPQDPQIQRGCQALRAALQDKAADVRQAAAEALGYTDTPPNVEALCQALSNDDSDWVRFASAHSLGELQSEAAIPALEDALQRDADEWVRAEAAEALGELQARSALPLLQRALLEDRAPWARQSIAQALSHFDDAQNKRHLAQALLLEKNADVRRALVEAFSDLQLREHLDELRKARSQEEEPRLRRKMSEVLRELAE